MRILLAVLGVALASSVARADVEPAFQQMQFIERGQALHLTTAIGKLFDLGNYEALSSGTKSTVVIRLWVYPRGSTEPISFRLLHRQVRYDLWDDVYVLEFDDPGGRRTVREKRQPTALTMLTEIIDLPVAALADIPYGSATENLYAVAIEVELNPVSKETLAEVRKWLSRGNGGGLERGGAFFGSFVSAFVNPKIPAADRVVRLRSQPFFRPRR
ncbi:MAG: hypothetical protein AB7P03_09835 [Kofleriaceae bacterium]